MTDESDSAPENRRGQVRRLVIMKGTILYNEGRITIPCRLRDISETGAKLELEQQQLLPHTFDLQIRDMPALRCRLRWARGARVGVEFVEEEDA
jgi:hypothetical protein